MPTYLLHSEKKQLEFKRSIRSQEETQVSRVIQSLFEKNVIRPSERGRQKTKAIPM